MASKNSSSKKNSTPSSEQQPKQSQTPSEQPTTTTPEPETPTTVSNPDQQSADGTNSNPTTATTDGQQDSSPSDDQTLPTDPFDGDDTDALPGERDENGDLIDPDDRAAAGYADTPEATETPADQATAPRVGAEPKGHIIGVGEELTIKATKRENFAIVDVDHFQAKRTRGSKRLTYVLIYTAGTRIPLSALEQK